MTSRETRAKWNEKYRKREDKTSGPDDFLVRHRKKLVKGRALDLASGDGRNSLFLAKEGFKVTAVDISDVALQRLARAAERAGMHVETKRCDLESGDTDWRRGLHRYENIVILNYKPTPEVIGEGRRQITQKAVCPCFPAFLHYLRPSPLRSAPLAVIASLYDELFEPIDALFSVDRQYPCRVPAVV
jgi:SAM-dependent methyltransferase